jgi:hypothetical protein
VNCANFSGKPVNRGRYASLNLCDGGFTMPEFTFNSMAHKCAGRLKAALFSLGLKLIGNVVRNSKRDPGH